jgi:hypothetical protein
MIHRVCLSILVLGCMALFAPEGRSQAMQGLWFRVTVKVNTRGVLSGSGDMDGLLPKLVHAHQVIYIHVDSNSTPGENTFLYHANIWSRDDFDEWTQSGETQFTTYQPGERLMAGATSGASDSGISIELPTEGGTLRVDFVANAKVKQKGGTTKASFKSIGAVVPEGSVGLDDVGTVALFGGATVRGKSVDSSKLPFDPS